MKLVDCLVPYLSSILFLFMCNDKLEIVLKQVYWEQVFALQAKKPVWQKQQKKGKKGGKKNAKNQKPIGRSAAVKKSEDKTSNVIEVS